MPRVHDPPEEAFLSPGPRPFWKGGLGSRREALGCSDSAKRLRTPWRNRP